MTPLTQVATVMCLADMVEALDMPTETVDQVGELIHIGQALPDLDMILYAGALRAATDHLGNLAAYQLNDMVIDLLHERANACECADEVALLRDECAAHRDH